MPFLYVLHSSYVLAPILYMYYAILQWTMNANTILYNISIITSNFPPIYVHKHIDNLHMWTCNSYVNLSVLIAYVYVMRYINVFCVLSPYVTYDNKKRPERLRFYFLSGKKYGSFPCHGISHILNLTRTKTCVDVGVQNEMGQFFKETLILTPSGSL